MKIKHENVGHKSVFTIWEELTAYSLEGVSHTWPRITKASADAGACIAANVASLSGDVSHSEPFLAANCGRIFAKVTVSALLIPLDTRHVSQWAKDLSAVLDDLMPKLASAIGGKVAQ